MKHDARDWILLVCIDRTALQTFGVQAMIASHGKVVALRVWIGAPFDLAYPSPAKVGRIAVLFVAGHLAGAAPDALGHVEVEAILFSLFERSCRNQRRAGRWDPGGNGHRISERSLFDAKTCEGQAHQAFVAGLGSIMKWQGQGKSLSAYA